MDNENDTFQTIPSPNSNGANYRLKQDFDEVFGMPTLSTAEIPKSAAEVAKQMNANQGWLH